MKLRHLLLGWLISGLLSVSLLAQDRFEHYALFFGDPPVADTFSSSQARKDKVRSAASEGRRQQIIAAQDVVKRQLKRDHLIVLGSTSALLNAVYVAAPPGQEDSLRQLPGVVRVQKMRSVKRHLNRALDLVNARNAWQALGGNENAGRSILIGIIDSGIDQTRPAFQDSSLTIPNGFPKCNNSRGECAFTNNKVIVARSYVDVLVLGDDPTQSRPDDLSPRDRSGHGTATAAVAAANFHQSPVGTLSGVAPKAYLGNYKVFGTPGINDYAFEEGIIMALEDAFDDGVDVVSLSFGFPALFAPNDIGSACNNPAGQYCDPQVETIQTVIRNGMAVVVSGGNSGDIGSVAPVLGSIEAPGSVPEAITVGATTNSRALFSTVRVSGSSSLQQVNGIFGAGPTPAQPLTAPVVDVGTLDGNGLGCSAFPTGSLNGRIALIQRGDCLRDVKINNAQAAGAVAVILYQFENSNEVFVLSDLAGTFIPTIFIGYSDGQALKQYLQSNPNATATLDPSLRSVDVQADNIAYFSSYGPAIGGATIKPDLVAPGVNLYVPTEIYDPNGDVYGGPSGFTSVSGTSFSAPMVAGAIALVLQKNLNLTPSVGQLKSAVVNTADNVVNDVDASGNRFPASVTAAGAGRLNVARAVNTNVTVEPSTLSFGSVTAAPSSLTLRLSNLGSSTVQLNLQVQRTTTDNNARVELSNSSVSLGARQSTQVSVRLAGNQPSPGSYEGAIVITGGSETLRVPFLYLVSDRVPYNIYPLQGDAFSGIAGARFPGGYLAVKVVDRFGLPVGGQNVTFSYTSGGGQISNADRQTDSLGIAAAQATLGTSVGDQEIRVTAGNLSYTFSGVTVPPPTIRTGGVVNAASSRAEQGYAPGSYITIYGSDLATGSRAFFTPYLPISLIGVSVSFDNPARGISVPGRITYVSPTQVNVQIPWELAGLSSAQMKISLDPYTTSQVVTVPIATASPAAFEYAEGSQLLVAALDQQNRLITSANAVQRGQVIQIYANGLGPVSNQPASGEVSPSAEPLARTTNLPTVTIGGQQAAVQFSGLAPGFVGLYQINAVVPNNIGTGIQPLVISVAGATSKTSNVPVR